MIDYEKRAKYLLGRLVFFHDQSKWEAENFGLVKLAPSLEQLLLNLDGDDSEDIKRRVRATDLLVLAGKVLSLERRQERLHAQKLIGEFLRGDA